MSGKSKFFLSSGKSKKRQASTEFGIFSDDDIEEALMSLPDPSRSAAPEDNQVELDEGDDSQLTLVAQSPEAEKETAVDDSEITFVEEESTEHAGRFDHFLRDEMKTLRRTASIQSQSHSLSKAATLSNLKRSPSTPAPKSKLADTTWDTEEATIIVPASDVAEAPLTPVLSQTTLPKGLLDHRAEGRGSEDLLVEESEADDEVDSPDRGRAWNLARFAFGRG
jgi:hypothetical protein